MPRLIAIALLLLAACDQAPSLANDTDQPLTAPTGAYWALRDWPVLVLSDEGTCPAEAVDAALAPFHAAGIAVTYQPGKCLPDRGWHVEDGRVCLRVDDEGLMERWAAGNASWQYRPGTTDQVTVGSISVMSSCNPMVIAHEVGHVLGLEHSEDRANTMFPAESDVLEFGDGLAELLARRKAGTLY